MMYINSDIFKNNNYWRSILSITVIYILFTSNIAKSDECRTNYNGIQATNGKKCTISGNGSYAGKWVGDTYVFNPNVSQKADIYIDNNSSVIIEPNFLIEHTNGNNVHGVQVVRGSLLAQKDFSITIFSGRANTRALQVNNDGEVKVKGNATFKTEGSANFASILENNGKLEVDGDVKIISTTTPGQGSNHGFRSFGNTMIKGNLIIENQEDSTSLIHRKGQLLVEKAINITAKKDGSASALELESGIIKGKDLNINSNGNALVLKGPDNKNFIIDENIKIDMLPKDRSNIILRGDNVVINSTQGAAINIENNHKSYTLIDKSVITGKQVFNDGNGDATLEIVNGSQLSGDILMKGGSDTLIFNGFVDLTNVSLIQGTNENLVENGEYNNLVLKNYSNDLDIEKFKGWSDLTLQSSTITLPSDDINSLGLSLDENHGIKLLENSKLIVNNDHNIASNLYVSGNSTVDLSSNNDFNTVQLQGNYHGEKGSTIKVNTTWNKNAFKSDIVEIQGTAEGLTQIIAVNDNGQENIIQGNVQQISEALESSSVVIVKQGGGIAFEGTARTDSLSEAQLAKRTDNLGVDEYFWTIMGKKEDRTNDVIWAPEVSAYIQASKANTELGYLALGTLNKRIGEGIELNSSKKTWMRMITQHLKLNSKDRLGFKGNAYGVQLGHDFYSSEIGSLRNTTGLMFTYLHDDNKFTDRFRSKNGIISSNKHTGELKTNLISLGLYSTYYNENDSYLDLVGQVSYLHNKYASANGINASQNGWGITLSAEVGTPILLSSIKGNGWSIEPQAQMIYQYLNLNNFNDGIKYIDQKDTHGLRGRIGVRFSYNEPTDKSQLKNLYGIVNIWHDFTDVGAVTIGRDSVKAKYAKTWGEVGLGIKIPTSRQGYIHTDIKYERSFSGENSRREAYGATVGFKYDF